MLELKPLSEELQAIAIEELGEVPCRIPDDLKALKEWVAAQPHLKARTDDQFLIQFLRGTKFSLERAKEKLDLFFSLKTKYPEMIHITDVDDAKFRQVSRLGCFVPLPLPLNDCGPRIAAFKLNYSPSDYNIDEIYRPIIATHEHLMISDPYTCIHGIIYLADFGNATAGHYLQLSPNFAKKIVSFVEKSMPFRIKAIYFINTSTAAQQFFKILFPFFSEKMRQRLHVMGSDLSELIKDVPLDYLPRDYGGKQPSMLELAADYDQVWDAQREYFKQNAEYGTEEHLRPGQAIDLDGLFGVGGSFRKLMVD